MEITVSSLISHALTLAVGLTLGITGNRFFKSKYKNQQNYNRVSNGDIVGRDKIGRDNDAR